MNAGLAVFGLSFAVFPGCAIPIGPVSPAILVPSGLTVEYRIDPLGIGMSHPRLGWLLESSGRGSFKAPIRSSSPIRRKSCSRTREISGTAVPSIRESLSVVYAGRPLRSGQRCFWKVRVWRRKDPSAWSPPAAWETALLDPKDWAGRWIEDGKPTPRKDEEFYADYRRPFPGKPSLYPGE